MFILKNISLKPYNTFGLDCKADCVIKIRSESEAVKLFTGTYSFPGPLLFVGRGSNLLFIDDFKGTIILPDLRGIRIEKRYKDTVTVSAGAGVEWDNLVEWSVEKGFGGIENLSYIPGSVGAAPVQNIGAYGVEIKESIVNVRTISCIDGSVRLFSNSECDFSYRNSIFKTRERGKYLVTRVYLKLNLNPAFNLNYGSLETEVKKLGGASLQNVRQAVINIRRTRLPDPSVIGNAGSFFRNPVVSRSAVETLKKDHPQMPCFEDPSEGHKLAAGWLIEQCGWKGKRLGDAGVHDRQALVLVNHGSATGKEIFDLSEKIRESVSGRFGIILEREVEVVGTI
jgi:UDP-N-acetylmuramate dehydrogenase